MKGQKHVLVVEDDEQMLADLKASLEHKGVVVYTATSYDEAMRLFMEHASHLSGMLVDGTLTEGSVSPEGAQFIRDVRRRGYTRPIVACSSSSFMNDDMVARDGATAVAYPRERGFALKTSGPIVLMRLLESA